MKLKVCGMKYNPGEVAQLRPDYLGFIFWEGSARHVGTSAPPTPAGGPARVGVFVDAPVEEVLETTLRAELDLLQLHGSESPDYCQKLASRMEDDNRIGAVPKIIKAFALGVGFEFSLLEAYRESCDFFLFDSRGPLPGGNGRAFDWKLLEAYPFDTPFFLSGGIGPDSGEALEGFIRSQAARYCHAVDVNSKFEIRPGEKDVKAVHEFMSAPFWAGSNTEKHE